MRTTLSIDDDVLDAARAMAEEQRRTVGEIISGLARKSLTRRPPPVTRNGIELLPITNKNARVTLEHVNAIRDEEP